MFARFSIPDILVTDNGPQLTSDDFSRFAEQWGFRHQTSPHYPQSNGKAEQAAQSVKRLFCKCKETGQPEFLAPLDWRNTPSEGMLTSPAEMSDTDACHSLSIKTQILSKQGRKGPGKGEGEAKTLL